MTVECDSTGDSLRVRDCSLNHYEHVTMIALQIVTVTATSVTVTECAVITDRPKVCQHLCGVHVLPSPGHHLQGKDLCLRQGAPQWPISGHLCGQLLWVSCTGALRLLAAASGVQLEASTFVAAA